MRVGSFPYNPGANPYQQLITRAISELGIHVVKICPMKLLPLHRAARRHIDVLHVDWPHDWYLGRSAASRAIKQLMFTSGLASRHRPPIVWTAHNIRSHDASNDDYEHRMMQRFISNCSGILTLNPSSAQRLRDTYEVPDACAIEDSHHGHYIDSYTNTVTQEEARRHLSIPDHHAVALCFGSLRPYKGHNILIDAFERAQISNATLIIAGQPSDSAYADQLQARVSRAVSQSRAAIIFRPEPVPHDEVQHYHNAADIAILPFLDILNSGSLMLAISFGLPVIGPRLRSIEHFEDSKLIDTYDPLIRDSLLDMLHQRLLPLNHATRAETINEVRAKFSWSHPARAAAQLYSHACS